MWIAVTVVAAAVIGALAWWLRRDSAGGDAGDAGGAEPRQGWELRLTTESEAAFTEGLRAYRDAGNPLDVAGEQGVLTVYEPPRLISLHLLADAFAARGNAAMHDPQGTFAALMAWCADTERPGVLHLRPGWLEDEVDGMDRTRFATAVREVVGGGAGVCHAEVGSLQVAVTAPVEEPSPHVNGKPVAALAKDLLDGAVQRSRGANTMMLDLARVLDHFRDVRDKQPDAAAGELLREIVARLVASGGPGVTWVRPPTEEERQAVLTAAETGPGRETETGTGAGADPS
ncbi:hypothetical protein ABZ897_18435 [Nonomuraea sp. NPDC046802]|uniref:hypothetical protein n=1 Tax=Nonomuraea sp. NPDC046802 TaxID=3154919 RepID=UPI0033F4DF3A